jgi:hypothetical protein
MKNRQKYRSTDKTALALWWDRWNDTETTYRGIVVITLNSGTEKEHWNSRGIDENAVKYTRTKTAEG